MPLARLKLNQNTTHEEVSFLGVFALFALTASAQSTKAPAEKKAKTEQTCSKDANKSTCSGQGCGCCSKGASNTDAKGAHAARIRLQAAAARALPPAPTPRAPHAAKTRPQMLLSQAAAEEPKKKKKKP